MIAPNHLKWKASLIVAAIFALGALTGAALNGIYLQAYLRASPDVRDVKEHSSPHMLEELRRDLQLSDGQIAAIRTAMEATRREVQAARLEQCPGMADARQHLMSRIRPLLTPIQRQRFDAVMGQRVMQNDGPAREGR